MHESSDLERTIEATLRRRTDQVRHPDPVIDAVFDRVDARRRRRRTVAGIGSVAAVGIGVLGIATLGDRGTSELESAGSPDEIATTVAVFPTTTVAPGGAWLWACSAPVTVPNGDPGFQYFRDCFQITDATATDDDMMFATTTIAFQEYVVQPGDSLSSIAATFGLDAGALVAFNGWDDGIEHLLLPGDIVRIPDPGVDLTIVAETPVPTTVPVQGYVVQPGDTIDGLRERWSLPRGLLTNLNPWTVDEDEIVLTPGELINVPGYLPSGPGLMPVPTTTTSTTVPATTTTPPPTTTSP